MSINIAVLASGFGSNLQAIIDAVKSKKIKANLRLVVSDNPKAFALKRAKKSCIETLLITPNGFKSKEEYDRILAGELKKRKIDLIVLAGFMRMLSPYFVKEFKNKILNIHPALLPAFKGAHAIDDALKYGAKVTGVTVHYVDEKMDHGPIIMQEAVDVKEDDSPESLTNRIHKVEHKLYPEAINLFINKRIKPKGRRVGMCVLAALILLACSCGRSQAGSEMNEEDSEQHLNTFLDAEVPNYKLKYSEYSKSSSAFSKMFSRKPHKKEVDDEWRPLTEDEVRESKKQMTYKAADKTAAFFESMEMGYVADKIEDAIAASRSFDKRQRKPLWTDFKLSISDDSALLSYKKKY